MGLFVHGWNKDLPDHRDHDYMLLHAAHEVPQVLPHSVDLSERIPTVYDQGQLGSCTANALGGAMQFLHAGFNGSRLQLYWNERSMEGTVGQDSGAFIRDGVKVLQKLGVAPESDWPYDINKFTWTPPEQASKDAAAHKISSYSRISRAKDFRSCLAAGYPFVVGITVYESFESAQVASSGFVPVPDMAKEQVLGGHAVLIVGYENGKEFPDGKKHDAYLMRNSWGSNWGISGSCWLPAAYLENSDVSSDAWTLRA